MRTFFAKNKTFLLSLLIFVILRIPSFFEGFWYVDEGFYAAQAEAILRGKELYLEAWDHKPPLMVWIYSLGGVLGWDFGYPLIKIFSVLAGVATLWLIYKLLIREKIPSKTRTVLMIFAVLLLGTPILEGNLANTELFFIPITTGIIYLSLYRVKANFVGLLLALTFLIKPQAFVEGIAIISLVGISDFIENWRSSKTKFGLKYYIRVTATFLFIIFSYFVYLFTQGSFQEFLDAVFITNFIYIKNEDGAIIWNIIKIISAGLAFAWMLLRVKSQKLGKTEFVVFSIVVVNIVLITLSGRPYPHYLLQIVPSMLFAFGLLTKKTGLRKKQLVAIVGIFLVAILFLFSRGLDVRLLDKARLRGHMRYYIDFPMYLAGNNSTDSWFWRNHSSSDWTREFVDYFEQNYAGLDYYYYGEQPWIFTQLQGNFINRYLVWYHLDYSEEKMEEGINASNEAMIVVVDEYSRRKRPQFFDNLEKNFTLLETFHNYTIYVNNEN